MFEFSPTFSKLEEFLKLYQQLHASGEDVTLAMSLPVEYEKAVVGYPDLEQNCWMTLRFAIDQMNRTYLHGKSKVRIHVQMGGFL
ncbi:hypothetical protein [Bdellovibrio sp. HCB2-146]|uniref:hypothetical protein n=1 Tax=Bdellovibrio sp. HCB2-146 TaxID=3394362 RepID=UPI0039BD328F